MYAVYRDTKTWKKIRRAIGNATFMDRNHIGGDNKGDAESIRVSKACQDGSYPDRPLTM